jgi:hypothetical protein
MSNKSTSPNFYQIPKFIIDHPKISGDHLFLFMILYDYLRQDKYKVYGFNKTNEYLSKITKIGKRQLISKLNELEEWGFIVRNGYGQKRKFKLGEKFNNSAESEPVSKSNSAEKEPIWCGKGTEDRAEKELHSKNLINNYNKKKKLSISEQQEINWYINNPTISVKEEHRYLFAK